MSRKIIFLTLLFTASLIIRTINLKQAPNGLSVDEADMAYNAYSILKTGKDVYNRHLPLFFQSLDDYKPPFAIYSLIPTIHIFGLSEFSARFPHALIGSLTPILAFYLAEHMYRRKRLSTALAVFFALSPWNIAISRATFMYIDLIFFYLVFLIFFLKAAQENAKYLILAAIVLAVTIYVYYSAIIYLPFIFILLLFIYKDFFRRNIKVTLISIFVFFVFSVPGLLHYLDLKSQSRLNAISILNREISLTTSIKEIELDQKLEIPLSMFTHNRRLVYGNLIVDNYFDYFNLSYLFFNSGSIRYFYTNYVGLFYYPEIVFMFLGLYQIITRRKKSDQLLLGLMLIGPIPASITLGSPLPHRGILLIFAIQIISALGLTSFLASINKTKYKKYSACVLLVIYFASVIFFIHQYFIHSPSEFASEGDNGAWYTTVRDVIPYINEHAGQYDKVVFTWAQKKLVPPVYFLFYNKLDPKTLQSKSALWTNEPPFYWQIYSSLGNIEFRAINWQIDKNLKNTLFIGYPQEFAKETTPITKSYTPNGKVEFYFVKTE